MVITFVVTRRVIWALGVQTCGDMEGHDRVGGEVARDDPPGDVKVEVRGCPGSEAAR